MTFTRNGAFEYLSRAHENGRLAHAYLISGPPGSDKRGLASDLASLVRFERYESFRSSAVLDYLERLRI